MFTVNVLRKVDLMTIAESKYKTGDSVKIADKHSYYCGDVAEIVGVTYFDDLSRYTYTVRVRNTVYFAVRECEIESV